MQLPALIAGLADKTVIAFESSNLGHDVYAERAAGAGDMAQRKMPMAVAGLAGKTVIAGEQ